MVNILAKQIYIKYFVSLSLQQDHLRSMLEETEFDYIKRVLFIYLVLLMRVIFLVVSLSVNGKLYYDFYDVFFLKIKLRLSVSSCSIYFKSLGLVRM